MVALTWVGVYLRGLLGLFLLCGVAMLDVVGFTLLFLTALSGLVLTCGCLVLVVVVVLAALTLRRQVVKFGSMIRPSVTLTM